MILTFQTDYQRLREPVAAIFARLAPDLKGKTVLVKPNALLGAPPEKYATTHPALVKAVVEELTTRGAVIWVGDNPGMTRYGKNAQVFEENGLREAAGEYYVNISQHPLTVPFTSRFTNELTISREVKACDYLINLPKLKTHTLTTYTGAIKNCFGYVCGSEKLRLHALAPAPNDFGELVADVYAIRPPDLTIMDAIIGMEGDGPNAGTPKAGGVLAASTDSVALDLVLTSWIGLAVKQVPHLAVAIERQWCPGGLEGVAREGPLPSIEPFRLPSNFKQRGPLQWLVRNLGFPSVNKTKVVVTPEKCTGCGNCQSHCPAQAIAIEQQLPRFDHTKCLYCYCCMEVCPQQALGFKRGVLKLIGRR